MEEVFLVIGLGSMGKRRIRNLKALGVKTIIGTDARQDRCAEAARQYDIDTQNSFEEAIRNHKISAIIISVPPDKHHLFIQKAIDLQIPAFIEASVVDTELEVLIASARQKKVLMAPSCTLYFHPAVMKIRDILRNEELGKISSFTYHSGQYLPDWHPYEEVSAYYVSNRATGGAREIVPFELSWITFLLGFPAKVAGMHKKTIDIPGAEDIDDTYMLLLDYGQYIFNLTVDVVSRYATRRLVINGDKKQLCWDWNDNEIRIYDSATEKWDVIRYDVSSAQAGYNKNITEQMYIDEMSAFMQAIAGDIDFPNTLERDHRVLQVLYAAERSYDQNRYIFLG